MSAFLSTILTFFFTMPFIASILAFIIFKLITHNTKRSVQKAIDLTTILFIISVHFLILTIWEKSLFSIILLVMIIIAMVFVFLHWKIKEEIVIKKVLKGFWRVNFILFFLAYITLTIYGLVHQAVVYTFFS